MYFQICLLHYQERFYWHFLCTCADLYVKLYVVNVATQKRIIKKKTRVCRHDREPSFNETFRFPLNPTGHAIQVCLCSDKHSIPFSGRLCWYPLHNLGGTYWYTIFRMNYFILLFICCVVIYYLCYKWLHSGSWSNLISKMG